MALEYRKVLCPIEFDDDNFLLALHTAADAVRGTDGTLFVLTAFPEVVREPAGVIRRGEQGPGGLRADQDGGD